MKKSFFSKNLKSIRKSKKISLEVLAEALNVSKSAISDYENDKFSPTLLVSRKIADYFGTTIDNMEYSEILEKNTKGEYVVKTPESLIQTNQESKKEIETLNEKNKNAELQVKLLTQKVEGLQIQLRLYEQLKDSKLSEIELLKTQVRLLEDKINVAKM